MGWIVMVLEWGDDERGSLKPDEKRIDISIDEMHNLFQEHDFISTITKLEDDDGNFADAINVECVRTTMWIGEVIHPIVPSYVIGKLAETVGGEGWGWCKSTSSSDGMREDTDAFLRDIY